MRIAIIADSFPPLKNSAAILVSSLAEALSSFGHEILVITPTPDIDTPSLEENCATFKVLRLRCGGIKSHIKFMRGFQELGLFFTLPRALEKAGYKSYEPNLIIWYSPSIFLGGLVRHLKRVGNSSYLILRDIVPEWLVDVGLMKKRISYHLLRWFELYQYRLADFIGVQSPGNRLYIERLDLPQLRALEVLPNWMPSISALLNDVNFENFGTNLDESILAGKKIFIYSGNLGEAQGVENFSRLLYCLRHNTEVGFLIIGRGSKKDWLQSFVDKNYLTNVLMLDEVDLETLGMYYRQCVAGLVFLNLNHQSHNIPGKFISYLEAGLPIMACVNANNDLIKIVKDGGLGISCSNPEQLAKELTSFIGSGPGNMPVLARQYYEKKYQPKAAAQQILTAAGMWSGDNKC